MFFHNKHPFKLSFFCPFYPFLGHLGMSTDCFFSGFTLRLWRLKPLLVKWKVKEIMRCASFSGTSGLDEPGVTWVEVFPHPQRLGGDFSPASLCYPFGYGKIWPLTLDLPTHPTDGMDGASSTVRMAWLLMFFGVFLAEASFLWMASWVVGLDPMHLINVFFGNHGFEVRGSHHVCLFPQMIANDST